MTADEVLEAMARASFMRGWVVPGGMSSDDLFALRKNTDRAVWQMHLANIRAAVRAAHAAGAILVAEMPNDLDIGGGGHGDGYKLRTKMGWNNALAAVRAKAIREGV